MKTINKNLQRIAIFIVGLILLSSCAVQKTIGEKKHLITTESLNEIKPKTVYTFYFNDNSKLRVKVSKVEAEILTGTIRSGKQHNEVFEITFEDIMKDVKSITTVSGKGIAGNLLIGGAVIVATYVLITLAVTAFFFALMGL